MNDYEKRYQKIVNQLVKKSFPTLKGEKIIVKEKKAKWRGYVHYFPWGMFVYLAEKLRKFPEASVRRIAFHELCHLEIFKRQGWVRVNLGYLLYLMSSKHRYKVERETNILMIKKGHGKEVLTARKGNIQRGLSYSLTEKEIKQFMEKYK